MEDRRSWLAGCLSNLAPSRHLGMERLCSTFVSTMVKKFPGLILRLILSLLQYQVLKGPMVSSGCCMPPWVWQEDPEWENEVAFCFVTQLTSWKSLRHHVDPLRALVAVSRHQVSAQEGIIALESSCNADYCRRNLASGCFQELCVYGSTP